MRSINSTTKGRHSHLFSFLLGPGVGIVLLLSCIGCMRNRKKLEETRQAGNQIVRALEAYHAEQGRYPPSLENLPPKFLKEIPRPRWGLRQWIYEPSGTSFTLQVNETHRTGEGDSLYYRYFPKDQKWEIGD